MNSLNEACLFLLMFVWMLTNQCCAVQPLVTSVAEAIAPLVHFCDSASFIGSPSWANLTHKMVGSSCFFFMDGTDSRTVAAEQCATHGAKLATIITDDIAMAVLNLDLGHSTYFANYGYRFHAGFESNKVGNDPANETNVYLLNADGSLRESLEDRNVTFLPIVATTDSTKKYGFFTNAGPKIPEDNRLLLENAASHAVVLCEKDAASLAQRYKIHVLEQEMNAAPFLIETGHFDVRECAHRCLMHWQCLAFDHRTNDGRCRMSMKKNDVFDTTPAANVIVYARIL